MNVYCKLSMLAKERSVSNVAFYWVIQQIIVILLTYYVTESWVIPKCVGYFIVWVAKSVISKGSSSFGNSFKR